MGKMVEVDIYESGKHFLKGQPVSETRVYTPSISKPLAKGEVSGLTKVSYKLLPSRLPMPRQPGKLSAPDPASVITYHPPL